MRTVIVENIALLQKDGTAWATYVGRHRVRVARQWAEFVEKNNKEQDGKTNYRTMNQPVEVVPMANGGKIAFPYQVLGI